jgi:hypothetical protein
MKLFVNKIDKITECQDIESASKTISEFTDLVFYSNKDKWIAACPPECTQKSYLLEVRKFHKNNWIQNGNEPGNFSKSAVGFMLAYENFVIEEQIETLVYDAGNFLAAVGGNLGLFLGFSCLTMLLGILKIVKRLTCR